MNSHQLLREPDLTHHGDAEVGPGLIDLAVNVRHAPMPPWLRSALEASLLDLAGYPRPDAARVAVAQRHGRAEEEVLLTAGAAEAFVLIARAVKARHCVVVHPQFTEPEAALRAAGHEVERILLPPPFTFDPRMIPADADLIVIGNPTNPTSVLHAAGSIATLCRPGRIVVVDEAFGDCVPGEPESLAAGRDLPGLVVLRSLTKTWALAGLRCGYLLAEPELIRLLASAQPLWPVSTPALAAITACSQPQAVAEADRWACELAADREYLQHQLDELGLETVRPASASFLMARHSSADELRLGLRRSGFAVRRGDTFPGLGPQWLRIAVRERATVDAFTSALAVTLGGAG
ncbi:L-threonine O-3-phosphate decarboxylase [Jatrophihabitans sp. GAS493]|uniref:Rv2231c family pyridoxal phosphate-dependent protein CobC n=1 Tax=Jatrophihabitans sp. GAS493 TaxID=1907575 RepID=UPI000BB6C7AC|nr:Rv2231c family pyridoxal phosphate-dependent protein CobC [Jatrophihabitans sp. GAS493]SOD74488.1 L-threonine O-3-phosphate decarboxylase [Jatrophihabitans sp. GAS493]